MDVYKFSPSTAGFYLDDVHGDQIPGDAVLVSNEQRAAILSAQAAGQIIGLDLQPQDPSPPSPEEVRDQVARAVDAKLDALARSWRYRDYISARSYRDDPNPRFAAEAAVLIAHGSACWTVLDNLEASVLAGTTQMPATVGEVLALLPAEPTRPA